MILYKPRKNTAFTPIKYGALYNWYAVTDSRNIASLGWEVPSEPDVVTLAVYLGGEWNPYQLNYGPVGGKLKETGLVYWDEQVGATNEVGFNSRGNGDRSQSTGLYEEQNIRGYIWTKTESGSTSAFGFNCMSGSDFLIRDNQLKKKGYAVRLIKTTTSLTHGQTGIYTGNDGKKYRTICIGSQEWLAQNLRETKYTNGELIPLVEDNTSWILLMDGALCYYNNDITNA
jgi:uncharacterized protein (TIGR02145 family)